MLKHHCDNCDALIEDAHTARRVSVQPHGFQCLISVMVTKGSENQELCASCLRTALEEFAASLIARTAEGRG